MTEFALFEGVLISMSEEGSKVIKFIEYISRLSVIRDTGVPLL